MRHFKPRKVRFSLRTVLIVMTLMCVWLGYITHTARQQRRAVHSLESVFARIEYDQRADTLIVPKWLRSLMGDDSFVTVVGVTLCPPVGEQGIQPMRRGRFELAIQAFEHLPHLRKLTFGLTQLENRDLALLSQISGQIEELELWEPLGEMTGNCTEYLKGFTRLQRLSLAVPSVNVEDLERLAELPALEILELRQTELDEEKFAALAACSKLQSITLSMCTFQGRSLVELRAAPQLHTVDLHNMFYESDPPEVEQIATADAAEVAAFADEDPSYRYYPAENLHIIAVRRRLENRSPDEQNKKWLQEILPNVRVVMLYSI